MKYTQHMSFCTSSAHLHPPPQDSLPEWVLESSTLQGACWKCEERDEKRTLMVKVGYRNCRLLVCRLFPSAAPAHVLAPMPYVCSWYLSLYHVYPLNPLADLAVSPLCYNLKHFRLRVPSRQITRHFYARPNALPSVELLDMSMSNVSTRLGRVARAPSQRSGPGSGQLSDQRTDIQVDAGEPFLQWMELGQTLALAGVKRATEREKSLRTWVDNYYAQRQQEEALGGGPSKKPKKGRKGLATAAFSFRAPSPERKDGGDVTISEERIPRRDQRVRILPSAPTLCSVATRLPRRFTRRLKASSSVAGRRASRGCLLRAFG